MEGNLVRQKAVDLDAVHSVKLVVDVDLAGSGKNSLRTRLEAVWLEVDRDVQVVEKGEQA